MTEWKETKFSQQPKEVMQIGPNLFMQTRNVRFVSDEEGYVCETREVTDSELRLLNELSQTQESLKNLKSVIINNI